MWKIAAVVFFLGFLAFYVFYVNKNSISVKEISVVRDTLYRERSVQIDPLIKRDTVFVNRVSKGEGIETQTQVLQTENKKVILTTAATDLNIVSLGEMDLAQNIQKNHSMSGDALVEEIGFYSY
jgi:hypothetical protein